MQSLIASFEGMAVHGLPPDLEILLSGEGSARLPFSEGYLASRTGERKIEALGRSGWRAFPQAARRIVAMEKMNER